MEEKKIDNNEEIINNKEIPSLNMNNNNMESLIENNKIYSIEKKHDDLLSFRKGGKKSGNDIKALCDKISNLLQNHEIESNKREEEKKTDFKKMFMKTTEKELEIFETERLKKKESFENLHTIKETEEDNNNKDKNNENEKCLSKVICTLSKIEGGYATFVSSNDLIFILPSLFIPKDLIPGNSYIFELCELELAENKINKVNQIHNFYSKEIVEEINNEKNE